MNCKICDQNIYLGPIYMLVGNPPIITLDPMLCQECYAGPDGMGTDGIGTSLHNDLKDDSDLEHGDDGICIHQPAYLMTNSTLYLDFVQRITNRRSRDSSTSNGQCAMCDQLAQKGAEDTWSLGQSVAFGTAFSFLLCPACVPQTENGKTSPQFSKRVFHRHLKKYTCSQDVMRQHVEQCNHARNEREALLP